MTVHNAVIDTLADAVVRYGRHEAHCALSLWQRSGGGNLAPVCDCGFAEVLAGIRLLKDARS